MHDVATDLGPGSGSPPMSTDTLPARTRQLLACGVLAGPLFLLTVTAQSLTRAGFVPQRHPLSLLSLGDLGWIQITNFVASGMLITASAVGIRRRHPP